MENFINCQPPDLYLALGTLWPLLADGMLAGQLVAFGKGSKTRSTLRCSHPLKLSGKRATIEDMCSRFEMIEACYAHYAYLLRAKRR